MKRQLISPSAREALELLGGSIRAARLRRKWTAAELAERVGVSRPTLASIERGDPTVAIGSVFEAAAIVGVPLFDGELTRRRSAAQLRTELALLPTRARRANTATDDDF